MNSKNTLRGLLFIFAFLFAVSYSNRAHTEETATDTTAPAQPAAVDAKTVDQIKIALKSGKSDGISSVGGTGGTKTVTAKGIYSIIGGLNMKFAIAFDQGTTDGNAYVITTGGNNEYTVSKVTPFAGKVICFKYGGTNKYIGCDEVKDY